LQPLDLRVLSRVVQEALDAARHMRQPAAAEEIILDPDAECEMIGFYMSERESAES
jgi:hypothetical protein